MAVLVIAPGAFGEPLAPVTFPQEIGPHAAGRYEFSVKEYRSYIFEIECDYADKNGFWSTLDLVGGGSQRSSGIPLPVHLSAIRLNDDGHGGQLYNQTTVTTNYYAHTFVRGGGGSFWRKVATINLEPGGYAVRRSLAEQRDSGSPSIPISGFYPTP